MNCVFKTVITVLAIYGFGRSRRSNWRKIQKQQIERKDSDGRRVLKSMKNDPEFGIDDGISKEDGKLEASRIKGIREQRGWVGPARISIGGADELLGKFAWSKNNC